MRYFYHLALHILRRFLYQLNPSIMERKNIDLFACSFNTMIDIEQYFIVFALPFYTFCCTWTLASLCWIKISLHITPGSVDLLSKVLLKNRSIIRNWIPMIKKLDKLSIESHYKTVYLSVYINEMPYYAINKFVWENRLLLAFGPA